VSIAVPLHNASPLNLDRAPLEATVYDADGAVIAAGSYTLKRIRAGETTGVAPHFTKTPAGAVAARIEVQVGEGHPVDDPPVGSLKFGQPSLVRGSRSVQASTIVTSTYQVDLEKVDLTALALDADGALIGGGTVHDRLIAANSSHGEIIPIEVSGTPVRIEIYAQLP
ncbi:MAG: hypothetical protein ACR2PL_03620, partial [Dehalococcoidia bacterium]